MIAKVTFRGLSRRELSVPFGDKKREFSLTTRGKEEYREFAGSEPSLPLFSRDWWLDATAGPDTWGVALVKKAGQMAACMPYMINRRCWMKVLCQPALTQKLGPWVRASDGKPAARLANEKELMQALIDQLPRFDYFTQNWHYGCTNWLPFAWNGFEQTTRYTYMLSELKDTEKVWSGFQHNIRSECKKASNRFGLRIRDDLGIDAFLALNRMTFSRQRMHLPYSDAFVRRLDAACAERGCRKFFIAVDPEGRHHAGLYIVWDEYSSYGLMIGSDPSLRTSGAVSLCFWEAIRHAALVTQRFDFGGSMLQPIERFFRSFGAAQVPYFNIRKTPSRLLRGRESLLSVIRSS
jgi:lipid II:glycine glycyltransferase (peptidoglycan interpeptide bridge formation enzyme)